MTTKINREDNIRNNNNRRQKRIWLLVLHKEKRGVMSVEIVKVHKVLLSRIVEEPVNHNEIKEVFVKLLEDIQCEKFITVGHILEIMFSLDVKKSEITLKLLIYLYDNKIIDGEDIKHG